MKFDDKQLLKEYLEIAKITSQGFYDDMVQIIQNAKHGDITSSRLLQAVICFVKLEKIEAEFYNKVRDCHILHNVYAEKLESLKQAFWGDYANFEHILDNQNKQYSAIYKTAMSLKKEYIELSKTRILAIKKVHRNNPNGNTENAVFTTYRDVEIDDEYVGKTNSEAIKIEEERLKSNVAGMEVELAKVRSNLNEDLEASKLAKEAVLESMDKANITKNFQTKED